MLVLRLVYLVGEVDEELRIALDDEALYPQCDYGFQASYQAFILCYVAGDLFSVLATELYGIVELVLSRRYEHCAGPRAMSGECPVDVNDPAIWCLVPGESDRSSPASRPGASAHSAMKSASAAPLMTLVVLNSS